MSLNVRLHPCAKLIKQKIIKRHGGSFCNHSRCAIARPDPNTIQRLPNGKGFKKGCLAGDWLVAQKPVKLMESFFLKSSRFSSPDAVAIRAAAA